MVQINLLEFTGYDAVDIFAYLEVRDDEKFSIRVPRLIRIAEPNAFDIFWDYHIAGFIGAKLHKIATSFGYLVPAAECAEPFQFHVATKNLYALAEQLKRLVELYDPNDRTDTAHVMQLDAAAYFIQAFEAEENFGPTFGLLAVANHYLQKTQ